MDELAPEVTALTDARAPAARGPRDLREWLERVEAIGELHRVTAEVHWDQEMSAIAYMAGQTIGGPALLFEKIAPATRPGPAPSGASWARACHGSRSPWASRPISPSSS